MLHDYAVVRIEGHPAKKLSFWIQRADFVRQYQKIDGFWLPQKDETFVQVRLYGTKVLTIEHQNYVVNEAQNKEGRMAAEERDYDQQARKDLRHLYSANLKPSRSQSPENAAANVRQVPVQGIAEDYIGGSISITGVVLNSSLPLAA